MKVRKDKAQVIQDQYKKHLQDEKLKEIKQQEGTA
jgi:hypothetical protein